MICMVGCVGVICDVVYIVVDIMCFDIDVDVYGVVDHVDGGVGCFYITTGCIVVTTGDGVGWYVDGYCGDVIRACVMKSYMVALCLCWHCRCQLCWWCLVC